MPNTGINKKNRIILIITKGSAYNKADWAKMYPNTTIYVL